MVSLEELKKQKMKLQTERMRVKEFFEIQKEKKLLKKEIEELKNPRSTAFRSVLKKGFKKGVILTGKGLFAGGKVVFDVVEKATRPPQRRMPSTKKRRMR